MAWTRRGSRRITVDGHRLRWVAHRRGLAGCVHCDSIYVIVGADDRKGSYLLYYPFEMLDAGVSITPGTIAAWVRLALADGWSPGAGERAEPYRFRDPERASSQLRTLTAGALS